MVQGDTKVTKAKGDARGSHGQADIEDGHGASGCNRVHELRGHKGGHGRSLLVGVAISGRQGRVVSH